MHHDSGNTLRTTDDLRETDYPPLKQAWYVVGILTLTYTVSFIDRQIMALLIEPIRRDLQITDTQVSLLIGLAFAVFYTLLGIPIARLADRYSRRWIIGIGISVWCLATAACGLARTYGQLFLARVGVGEGALSPSALSMISDYFPKHTRVRAIAVYNMGISLGTGLALIVGGQIVQHVMQAPPVSLPVVGELFAWQTVFIIVGLPGLLMAVLMMTIKEPRRLEQMHTAAGASRQISARETLGFLGARWKMYASHFLGMSTVAILAYGLSAWIPSMFIRTFQWKVSDIGLAYGCIVLAAGPLAAVGASWLSERLTARGYSDAPMRAALIFVMVGVVGAVGAGLSTTPTLALVFLLPASIGTTAATACGLTALVSATPNQMRAQASAVYYLVVNIFGLTVGPTGIALFTDHVFANPLALPSSIAAVSTLAGIFAFAFLTYNLAQYRAVVSGAGSWTAPQSA